MIFDSLYKLYRLVSYMILKHLLLMLCCLSQSTILSKLSLETFELSLQLSKDEILHDFLSDQVAFVNSCQVSFEFTEQLYFS